VRDKLATLGLLLFVGLIVGYLFLIGVLDSKKAETRVNTVIYQTKGAANAVIETAEEMVGPTPQTGPTAECIATCKAVLKEVEVAKRVIRQKGPSAVGSASMEQIAEQLGYVPRCGCQATIVSGNFQQSARAVFPNEQVIVYE